MTSLLRLSLITPVGQAPLGEVSSGVAILGRDVSADVVLESSSVSRQHGVVTRVRNHWVFKDLGSTNGSWHNGQRVAEGTIRLLRNGDLLQLADVGLKVSDAESPSVGMRSVIIFSRGEFLDEYPIPTFGRSLAIGGAQADLALEGFDDGLAALVIEGRGEQITATALSPDASFSVNGADVASGVAAPLHDRDELRLAHFHLVVSAPTENVAVTRQASQGNVTVARWEGGREAPTRAATFAGFGTLPPVTEEEPTMMMGAGQGRGGVRGRSTTGGFGEPAEGDGSMIEDRVVMGIAVALVGAVVLLLLWWLLR